MTMSSPLQSRPTPRQNPPRAPQRPVPLFAAAGASEDDEFRMNLSDLPRMSTGLQVDGFQPSLVSRVLDLIDRLRKR